MKNMGIGIDVVNVDRFRKLPYTKNKSFYKKIFLQSEIDYCLLHKNSSQHFAGKFAIKEATKKSIHNKIRMLDIITSHKSSRPRITLRNNTGYDFLVSVSHDSSVAIAVVVSERKSIK